jgi:KDO2-lipid IV(A) lauroyltransferase
LLVVISILPTGWTLAVADVVGSLVFLILPKRKKIAVENILAAKIVDDRREAVRLARRCFQSFTRLIAESVLAHVQITKDNWREFVTIEASPAVMELLETEGQGAIVASGHIGNWEVAARAASMIKPVNVIYRPLENPYLERELNGGRGGEQLHHISKYKESPMRFVKILANGEMLALMIDQHISEVGERLQVEFFGRPCWTTRSVAMMHMTMRKPLLVACAVRTGKMKFTLHVTGPIQFQRTGDRERVARVLTQSLTNEIEKVARQHPDQYLWGHRRWQD